MNQLHEIYPVLIFSFIKPCSSGAEGGGVKRSIGEIVDTDEPTVPRKKKYAKEAWPGTLEKLQP